MSDKLKMGMVASFLIVAAIATLYYYLLLPSGKEFQGINPTTTAFIEFRKLGNLSTVKPFTLSQEWMPLDEMPNELVRAILFSEDLYFFEHGGVDWREFSRSLRESVTSLTFPRGASTITQQLVKNLYLDSSRNISRKLKELVLAWRLEATLSKSRILEIYLNIVEFGEGVFGVAAGCRYRFNRDCAQLNNIEFVQLAAVLPDPLRSNGSEFTPSQKKRAQRILHRMELMPNMPWCRETAFAGTKGCARYQEVGSILLGAPSAAQNTKAPK